MRHWNDAVGACIGAAPTRGPTWVPYGRSAWAEGAIHGTPSAIPFGTGAWREGPNLPSEPFTHAEGLLNSISGAEYAYTAPY